MYGLLRYLPKNYLSYCFGAISQVPLPKPIGTRLYGWYSRRYGVNLSESEFPPEYYRSLAGFFTRNLRPGARTIESGIVSPVDGVIAAHGAILGDALLQAKGRSYTLDRLLRDSQLSALFRDGYYITIYLAPGDYHHIHAPVDGTISYSAHIPGMLWPVNSWSVGNIDELFCVNERVITLIESGFGSIAVIKVGATNVGAITVEYDRFRANANPGLFDGRSRPEIRRYDPPIPVQRGERIGTFRLGSTVLVLFESGKFFPNARVGVQPVRLGQRLDAGGTS